jgi:K+-sensing histidine kinase KdpD
VVRRNPEEPVLASGRLFLLIEDFGVGFANPEQLEGRGNLDSTPGTKGEHGAGIGLAVCRGLAGRIDARLELVRSDARGSVVSLSLPLASL